MKIEAIWMYSDLKNTAVKSAYMKNTNNDGTPSTSILELSMNKYKEQKLLNGFIEKAKQYIYPQGPIGFFEYEDRAALYYRGNHPLGCCVIIGSDDFRNIQGFNAFLLIQNILAPNRSLDEIINQPKKFTEYYQPTDTELSPYKQQIADNEASNEVAAPPLKPCGFSFGCFSV